MSWKATFFVRLPLHYLVFVADSDLLPHNRTYGIKRPRNSNNWVLNCEAKGSNSKSVGRKERSSILEFCLH